MQLALERCTIRDWRLDDAALLAKYANNRRVWLGLRDLFPHPYTIDDANEFLQRATTEQPRLKFAWMSTVKPLEASAYELEATFIDM
jgi:RimJ/RimL family protein N-acetyltransferase